MDLITGVIWFTYALSLYFLIFWLTVYLLRRNDIKEELKDDSDLKRFPLVSVMVPAYNEEKTIIKTLQSIVNLNYPKEKLEILVIDDGSKDRTSEIVSKFIKKNTSYNIKLIIQENAGKAKAMNNGLKIISGELFACLDADSFVEKDTLKNMVRMHLNDSDLAVVTPVMRVDNPKTWIQKFQRVEYIASMLVSKLMSYLDCNYVAPGPFSTYKTKIVQAIGGFDEHNLVEDQEIAYKIQKADYRIRQCSNGFVRTVAPSTVKGLGKQRNRWVKGTLLTIFDYKHMIFNRNYGDFGMFQLPLTLSAYFLSVMALVSFCYYLFKPFFLMVKNLYLIGFDFATYFSNWSFSFSILDINGFVTLIVYLMLLIGVMMLFFASRMTDDKLREYGFFYMVPYFFVYFIILSFITVKVLLELVIGKKQKW